MNKIMTQKKSKAPSLRQLSVDLRRLRRRVEDLEDLHDLNEAIKRNKGRAGTPWVQANKELAL